MSERKNAVRRVRAWLAVFVAGLVLSGITAGPIERELGFAMRVLHWNRLEAVARTTGLMGWMERACDAVRATDAAYPFLAYGTDWLVFAHVMIAVAFVGPLLDPVRNRWVIEFGLMACAAVIPWAMVAGAVRGIPLGWRMIDCSFGVLGAVPLVMAMRGVRAMEGAAGR